MHGLNPSLLFASVRLRSTFADDIGNERAAGGTGFWIQCDAGPVLVTNRHNLDPSWLFPDVDGLRLVSLAVELRHYRVEPKASNITKMFEVELGAGVHQHADADCAIIVSPKFTDHYPNFRQPAVSIVPADLVSDKQFPI
jgi:hypothetical protein